MNESTTNKANVNTFFDFSSQKFTNCFPLPPKNARIAKESDLFFKWNNLEVLNFGKEFYAICSEGFLVKYVTSESTNKEILKQAIEDKTIYIVK